MVITVVAWAMAMVPTMALEAMVAMAVSISFSMADTSPQDFADSVAICERSVSSRIHH